MNYKKSYKQKEGYTPICEIGKCSLQKLEFGIIELHAEHRISYSSQGKEAVFIILGGRCTVEFDDGTIYKNIGIRRSVFEGKATAVYIPRHRSVVVSTDWYVKIVVNATPVDVDTDPQLITPDMVRMMRLGVKPFERDTTFIVDEKTHAKCLTIGEAYVTPGNWAGFPPHKHDEDNMPFEGIAEEIYYFLFDPVQGFALQRLYTTDGTLDETYAVKNDELVEFPRGYHTTVGAPGYNTYFLWSMAGEHQGFYRANDPDHEWVCAVENLLKKNN